VPAKPKVPEPFRPKYIQRSAAIAQCCGACTLAGFPEMHRHYNHETGTYMLRLVNGRKNSDVIKDVSRDLKHHCSLRITDQWGSKEGPQSMMLVILNNTQLKYYDKLLKEYDFEIIKDGVYHTYAGKDLTLYCRIRYPKSKDGKPQDNALGANKDDLIEVEDDFADEDCD
jgi:hypothetical protein